VVGFSGGADSLFLLDLLHRSEHRPTPLVALHVHHGLRGLQADLDEQFCREFCRERGILLEVRHARLDPLAPGLEQRARLARRRFLREVCARHGLSRILLAHQLEDADETQLMRWLRGSDWSGLSSLRARRNWRLDASHTLEIVRPLLGLTRGAIRGSLQARGLVWREDASNLDRRHSRNRVRADLVPLLGPEFVLALRRLRQTCESLEQRIESLLPRCELQPAPATFGFCRVPDQVCSPDALDADCFLDQVCDLLGFEGNLGLCVDACTVDGDCATGDVCDTARGVCRTPCTGTGAGVCTAPAARCQAGYCEQNPM